MVDFVVVTDNDLLKYTLFNRSKLAENGCWEWTSYSDGGGYGNISRNGKTQKAHRVSYEAFKGPIPPGLVVRHTCDNPCCVNPDHLILGTQKDNMADRDSRGRRDVKGEQVGTAKLTEKEVLEIRASSESLSKLAAKYNVDKSNVYQIKAGKSWKHLSCASA
jgi:HNH endonuclease